MYKTMKRQIICIQQNTRLTCFNLKLLMCNKVSSRKFLLPDFILSDRVRGLGEPVRELGLCEGERVGGLGDEDRE